MYARLFPGRGEHESVHAQPDWDKVHRELARVGVTSVSYTHLRAHETVLDLVCRLLLEKKKYQIANVLSVPL